MFGLVSKKQFEELEKDHQDLRKWFIEFREELNTNGMATAVNKLNQEVFKDTKPEDMDRNPMNIFSYIFDTPEEPTLKAKVDAIVNHFKIEFNIKGAQQKQVVATTKPKTVKTQTKATKGKKK